MRIVVCVKPVLDPRAVRYDPGARELCPGARILNSLDRVALEAAHELREATGGEVIAVALGGAEVDSVLREALIRAANRALWIDRLAQDPVVTSAILAEVLGRLEYDLILCGSRSDDFQTEFVATAIARRLGLPSVMRVVRLERHGPGVLRIAKAIERGEREIYELPLPALVGVDRGLSVPRYVPIMSRAYRQGLGRPVDVIGLDSFDAATPGVRSTVGQPVLARPRTKGGGASLSFWDRIEERERPGRVVLPCSERAITECVLRLRAWVDRREAQA